MRAFLPLEAFSSTASYLRARSILLPAYVQSPAARASHGAARMAAKGISICTAIGQPGPGHRQGLAGLVEA
jgi:hypothetical protein